jgi:hypothetical protein
VRCGCPNYLFLSVPDEGYSRNVPCAVAVQTIYFWAYQMRVVPEMCRALWLSKLFIFERTRWELFQKCAVRCGCPSYLFLSVPDEGYSRNVPCAVAVQTIYFWAYQMRVILEMCRALWLSKLFIFERTRWGLFQKCAMRTKLDFSIFVPDQHV